MLAAGPMNPNHTRRFGPQARMRLTYNADPSLQQSLTPRYALTLRFEFLPLTMLPECATSWKSSTTVLPRPSTTVPGLSMVGRGACCGLGAQMWGVKHSQESCGWEQPQG